MDIMEKMKSDWDRRATVDAKFWIDTTRYQSDAVFDEAGEANVARFLEIAVQYMKPSWHVLDVGCGIGRMVKPMASRFAHVSGVDVSAQMILQGQQWLAGVSNTSLFEGNGVDLKVFESSTFDFVYSSITFQHMPREVFNSYLPEINRVLRPGGFLEFQMCMGEYREPSFEDTLTVRVYEPDELVGKLKKNGFEIVERVEKDTEKEGFFDWIVLVRKQKQSNMPAESSLLQKDCIDGQSTLEMQLTFQLAKNYIAASDFDKAEDILKSLVANFPECLEGWLELSILFAEQQRAEDAINTVRKMLDAHPTFFSGYFNLGELYINTCQYGKILEIQELLKEHQRELTKALEGIESLARQVPSHHSGLSPDEK